MLRSKSIVEYYAEHEGYRCGYCRSPNTNFSHGLWAHTMTVSDYQDLIDRGWRRSGKYCYKPTMDVTCCPMYTIRCQALEFKASKSQKKVLKHFNKYLMGHEMSAGDSTRKMSTSNGGTDVTEEAMGCEQFVESTREHQNIDITNVLRTSLEEAKAVKTDEDRPKEGELTTQETSDSAIHSEKEKEIKKGAGPDPNKLPSKKAKQIRHERKLEKLKEKGIDVSAINNTNKNREKQIEDFIHELPDDLKQKLEIRLVRTTPPSPEWQATAKETHEVYVKYQIVVHDDKPEKCTEIKFREFLVQSPLLEEYSDSGPACGYGSFHQQYWLNGKLIAVGVIDILPKCVSSVYFFYDPDYMHLTLGTYGALREIEFTRHLHSLSPEIKYYYMGYYIHSCRKMRYKGNFYPSDLLCPETYKWFPLKECIPKLEQTPYSRLDPDIDGIDSNFPTKDDINRVLIFVNGTLVPYQIYRRGMGNGRKDDMKILMDYARLVGSKTVKNLVLVRLNT